MTSGIWIVFLSLVGLALLVVAGYYIYYRISINKSLHSDKPHKRIPPQNVIIAVLAVLLAVSVGFSAQRIAHDFVMRNTDAKYFKSQTGGTVFDPLFDSEDVAKQHGYLLTVFEESGFEICMLTGGRNGIMPNAVIRARYADTLPTLADGEHLDFSFGFWHKNTGSTENFVGTETGGEYRTQYITCDIYGRYDVKIRMRLFATTDKTGKNNPFAETLIEMNVEGT